MPPVDEGQYDANEGSWTISWRAGKISRSVDRTDREIIRNVGADFLKDMCNLVHRTPPALVRPDGLNPDG